MSELYLSGRRKWGRPQAMIWSDKRFVLVNGGYVPQDSSIEGADFIVITDHARSALNLSPERIESRSRMINGTSRSHHVADKLSLSTEWSLLPGRISLTPAEFDRVTGERISGGEAYVADEASSATDLIDWYRDHPGPFWVYLSYDKGSETDTMIKYSSESHMYFSNFTSSLSKRGLYDMWDISVSLGEV